MKSFSDRHSTIGILLAAGQSTRFGPTNKCMYRLPSGTAIGVQAAINLSYAVDHVVCIVPESVPRLNQILLLEGFKTLVNVSPEKGMAESIRLGVSYARENIECQRCLIALADMPWIETKTLLLIVEQLILRGTIVAPRCNRQRGHPVGFDRRYFSRLEGLSGDRGAREVIKSAGEELVLVDVTDEGVLQDIDTNEDLKQAEKRIKP